MAGLGTIATIASLAGTAVSAIGTIAAGRDAQRQANYEAAQFDVRAKEERAQAQKESLDVARKRRLALSRLQAIAAASGFGASDPSVLDLLGETAKYGTFEEQMARYGGTSRAAGLRAEAEGRRMAGSARARQSYFNAAGTILGGVSSMFRKYGQGATSSVYG